MIISNTGIIKNTGKTKGAWRHTELEVIQALRKLKQASSHGVGAELELSHKWVAQVLKKLKLADRIYISDWKKTAQTGDIRQMYSLKCYDEEDQPKPAPLSASDRTKNYRRRLDTKLRNYHARKLNDPELTSTSLDGHSKLTKSNSHFI